jgi:hypothetical protein
MNGCIVYTKKNELFWKLFSPNSYPSYPSRQTHPSYIWRSGYGGRPNKSQLCERFYQKNRNVFVTISLPYPHVVLTTPFSREFVIVVIVRLTRESQQETRASPTALSCWRRLQPCWRRLSQQGFEFLLGKNRWRFKWWERALRQQKLRPCWESFANSHVCRWRRGDAVSSDAVTFANREVTAVGKVRLAKGMAALPTSSFANSIGRSCWQIRWTRLLAKKPSFANS